MYAQIQLKFSKPLPSLEREQSQMIELRLPRGKKEQGNKAGGTGCSTQHLLWEEHTNPAGEKNWG